VVTVFTEETYCHIVSNQWCSLLHNHSGISVAFGVHIKKVYLCQSDQVVRL